MAHPRSWEVLTELERASIDRRLGDDPPHAAIGIGYATWLRAVQGKLIPSAAAALCRHWIRKRAERARKALSA